MLMPQVPPIDCLATGKKKNLKCEITVQPTDLKFNTTCDPRQDIRQV